MERTVVKVLAVCLCAVAPRSLGQTTAGLVNVAIEKWYRQSSIYQTSRTARYAANGDTGTEFTTTNCIHTSNNDRTPWWEVDLGRTYPVYNITIYARSEFNSRLANSKITVDGVECHSIGNQSPPDVYNFNCSQVLFGREVRIARTYRQYEYHLNMCEFQIWVWSEYASCRVGTWGSNCGYSCSSSCGGDPGKILCSQSTGACFVCAIGRHGDNCEKDCDTRCKDSVCNRDTGSCLSCQAGRYGDYCEKTCDTRCKDSVCNQDTGSCLMNVALNQQASMSSRDSGSGPAGNAVNGDRGSETDDRLYQDNCIKTGNGDRKPWWQVDLGRKYPVHSITISALRFNQYRIVPSYILVDNQQCYRYDRQIGSRTPTIQCTSTLNGQTVRIQRDYKSDYNNYELTVCEFEVWVCTPGFYGDKCDSRCQVDKCVICDQGTGSACYECQPGWYSTDCSLPCKATSCKANQCDTQTGLCTECDGNYGGPNCTDCAPGFYGTDCGLTCISAACLDGVCDRTSGWCNECPAGKWKEDCTQNCSSYCRDNTCALSTGHCLSCLAGWWGSDCSQTCSSGCGGTGQCDQDNGDCLSCASRRWGAKCEHTCPDGCGGNRECDVQTGHCLSCPAGFWGHYCNSTCLSDKCLYNECNVTTGLCNACWAQTYGELPYCECTNGYYYSNRQCLQCYGKCYQNGPCNKTTGLCDKCPPGKRGDYCTQACPAGRYGQDCAEQCGECSQRETTCDAETGHCVTCKPGWTPPFCNECQDGYYGQDCSETCGNCSAGAVCDKATGACLSCPTGLQPPLCKQNCDPGTYGDGCTEDCGSCQGGGSCHHETGECAEGCASGFTGSLCMRQVQEEPGDAGGNAGLIGGAVGGLLVAIIIAVIVIVLVVRKRKRTPKPVYDDVREELAESSNGLNQPSELGTNGSPLSFEPIVGTTTGKPEGKPKASVKPQPQPKPPRAPKDKTAIYENVAILNEAAQAKQAESASPKLPPKDKKSKQPKKGDEKLLGGGDTPEDYLTDDEEAMQGKADSTVYANEDTYYNVDPASLSLDSLQRQLLNKLRARDRMDEEFQEIPVLDEQAAKTHGERQENYMKNRFNSILPYDRSRVVLDQIDGDDASDYVNATFVRGYKSEKAYIAAQGPKNNTVNEFWRMVWLEHVTHIVMLTNLQEHNKWKCYGYWPGKGAKKTYGPVEVTGVKEEQRAHYVIRTFDISHSGEKGKRRVHQYHYVSWFDHEVPATTPLVDFWRYVKTCTASDKYPLLVHCSAGVGRTGTYIALDVVIDQAQSETKVSLKDVVRRLRDDRCNMVQNKGQYAFLHEAVLEAYSSLGTRLDLKTFDSVFPQPVDSSTPHQRIDKEFDTLRQMRSCFTHPVYQYATQDENRGKNRNPNALPDDRHLVFLTSHVRGRNQYINAVYMSTFHEPRGSILTQLPLPNTVLDMWRLVEGCKVQTIVAIGDVEYAENTSYWPRNLEETVKTGSHTVALKASTKLGSSLSRYTLSLDSQDQSESRTVEVLHYEDWKGDVPGNTTDMLNLLDTLESGRKERKGSPFVVQCIDGAAKSGLFCALYDVMCRVTHDEEVDVYLAVRRVQSVRPEAVPSVEQYRYCYELLQHYRNTQNVYANA